MNTKTTNSKQYEKLVSLLSDRPDIAKGFPRKNKEESILYWEDCTKELNSLGPPIRDAKGWRRVWTDYKSYIKKKLSHNQKEIKATGGGPNKLYILSDIEEMVVKITCINRTVEGIKGTQCTYSQVSRITKHNSLPVPPPSLQEVESIELVSDTVCEDTSVEMIELNKSTSSKSNRLVNSAHKEQRIPQSIDLLKRQVNTQEKFLKQITTVIKSFETTVQTESSILNSNIRIDNLVELQRLQLEEIKRHNQETITLMNKKMDIKTEMLNLELERLSS